MKGWFQKFMVGRYGADEFSRFINIIVIAILMLGIITLTEFTYLGMAGIVYNYFRVFSKNTLARTKENALFLLKRNQLIKWLANKKQHFSQRKTHRFFKCSSCKKTIRVPRGKGNIEITCPVCQNKFIGKS